MWFGMYFVNFFYTWLHIDLQEKEGHTDLDEMDISAWLGMMFENYGLTIEQANEAAIIIQVDYIPFNLQYIL